MNLPRLIEELLRRTETDVSDTIALRNLTLDLSDEAETADELRAAAQTIRHALEEHSFALTWISALDSLARQALQDADRLEGKNVEPDADEADAAPHSFASFQLPGTEGRDPSPMYAAMLMRKAVRLLDEAGVASDARKDQIYELSPQAMAPFVARLRAVEFSDNADYNQRLIEIAGSLLSTLELPR